MSNNLNTIWKDLKYNLCSIKYSIQNVLGLHVPDKTFKLIVRHNLIPSWLQAVMSLLSLDT